MKKFKECECDVDFKDFGDVIKCVFDVGIFVFCVVGDVGNFFDEEYFYEFDCSCIIRIGVVIDDGRFWERLGDIYNLNFIFLGCLVVLWYEMINSSILSYF